MSPEVALNRISPMLSPFISSVVRNGKVGLDATNCLRITDLKSGCTSLTPGPNCDRFKLHIPYAGETLKWDIIFNAQYPELPPDFIFGEDAEFLPDPSALHNLASWNPSDPECLLLVVKELVQQYHQFQCSRLRESSRLMFEYQTLLEEPQYGENMEIYAGKKNNWTGEFSARFLLKLPVDFSNIPTYLLKDVNEDPGEDVALLSVSFEDTEATQVYPKLYLSPRIEHALGGSSALHIPAFPGGGCLIDYVPQVCHLLTNKVQYVIQGYHKRREYIAAFLSHFGTGVVEYDAEGFTKLTLLLMWKDFCFLVHTSRNQRGLRGLEMGMGPSPPQSDSMSIFPAKPGTQEYRVWKLTCPSFFLETSRLSHSSPSITLPTVDSFIPRPRKIIHTAPDGMEMKWPKEQRLISKPLSLSSRRQRLPMESSRKHQS
ncbi:BRISC and BRCA1-A complex member 2 isoform X2 [Balaenoptera acutorostrata]|uniref:BRISC and BRCA1-A complex member 2 n=1 Tax=Balaenoptera acutorostrata TaxID=9767 RepID=A0ABM3UJV5_BALAC|nr:BRISC and BRCA1-A complex member 2 isoform X2 [Balaenoptera acutorostrata]